MKWFHAYFQEKIPTRSALGKEPFVAHFSASVSLEGFVSIPQACPRPPLL